MAYQILISAKTKSNAIRDRCYTSAQPRRPTLGGFRHSLYNYRLIENDFDNIESRGETGQIFSKFTLRYRKTQRRISIKTNRHQNLIYKSTSSLVHSRHTFDVTQVKYHKRLKCQVLVNLLNTLLKI